MCKQYVKAILILFTALVVLGSACYAQRAPRALFNPESLESLDADILKDKYGKISSLIIYHSNRIVLEKYYGFSQASTLHPISSVTKSITSIAVGVCIDKAIIPSLDVKIVDYFPEYKYIFEMDTRKKAITLKHLLNQTSGFLWDEWTIHYSYAGNPLIELSHISKNWIPIILGLPMETNPGEKFSYNSSCSDLIKEIISRSSGMNFKDFVEEYILKKLNISTYNWDTYPLNGEPAWGGLSLTTPDMAKIGILLHNKGKWGAQRIISEDWVNKSTSPNVLVDSIAYGYHWWVGKQPDGQPLIFAAGYGDQYVFIAPDKSIVVAVNARNFTDNKWSKDHNDLISRIINAYTAGNPLGNN
jgi:hypothetical protein